MVNNGVFLSPSHDCFAAQPHHAAQLTFGAPPAQLAADLFARHPVCFIERTGEPSATAISFRRRRFDQTAVVPHWLHRSRHGSGPHRDHFPKVELEGMPNL